jgi:hypothetical protein
MISQGNLKSPLFLISQTPQARCRTSAYVKSSLSHSGASSQATSPLDLGADFTILLTPSDRFYQRTTYGRGTSHRGNHGTIPGIPCFVALGLSRSDYWHRESSIIPTRSLFRNVSLLYTANAACWTRHAQKRVGFPHYCPSRRDILELLNSVTMPTGLTCGL